jgi:hypothetical protein
MDKASNSLSQTPPRPNCSPWRRPIVDGRQEMLIVAAMSEARQVVKARLRRENCKPSHIAQRETASTAFARALARVQSTGPRAHNADAKAAAGVGCGRAQVQMAKRKRPVCVLPRTII